VTSRGRNCAVRSALAGAVAGAVGTMAMDLVWFERYRRGGGTQEFLAWETADGVDRWDQVSAPGRAGQKLVNHVTGRDLPDRWARSTTNVVHWATGVAWGAQFGLVNGPSRHHWGEHALLFGSTVWLTSYVVLPLAMVYQPIWKYDAKTLAKDLSAHLVYGGVTAATFAAVTSPVRRP
jgi:hypothetical protein